MWSRPASALLLTLVGACGFHPSGELPGGADAADAAADAGDAAVDDGAPLDAAPVDAGDAAALDAADAAPLDAAAVDAAPLDAAAVDAAVDGAPDAAVDAGPVVDRTLIDDTAADFGAGPPAALTTGRIDALGVVAPFAYYVGGLCAGGSSSRLFDDGTTATWADLPAAARLGLARYTDLDVASGGVPTGVGIAGGTDWTLWLEGEVFLTQGAHTIGLAADDHGFVELAPPGATSFTKILGVNTADGEQAVMYTAAVAGWYGVRYAVAQRLDAVELYLEVDGVKVPRFLTRCRVDQRSGLAMLASDEAELLDVAGSTIDASAQVVNADWAAARPADLGLTGNDTFAVRWSGQLRIDVAGAYSFRLDTDDGQRLWLDGVRLLDAFDDNPHAQTTAAVTLAPGWHDLVVESTEAAGDAHAVLRVQAGPELTGAAIPAARLRPAEARGDRLEARTTTTAVPIDGSVSFTLDLPAGATVTGVDVGYRIQHGNLLSVSSRLAHGAITSNLRGVGSAATIDRFHPAAWNGQAAGGTWTLSVDAASLQSGTIHEAWLTVHYADATGLGPIAPGLRYESSVRDLLAPTAGAGAVVSLGALRGVVRDVPGDALGLWLRSCDTPAACAAEPWLGPYASGAAPGAVPRRYVQYAVDLASDTDHEPALDRFELDYQTQ